MLVRTVAVLPAIEDEDLTLVGELRNLLERRRWRAGGVPSREAWTTCAPGAMPERPGGRPRIAGSIESVKSSASACGLYFTDPSPSRRVRRNVQGRPLAGRGAGIYAHRLLLDYACQPAPPAARTRIRAQQQQARNHHVAAAWIRRRGCRKRSPWVNRQMRGPMVASVRAVRLP